MLKKRLEQWTASWFDDDRILLEQCRLIELNVRPAFFANLGCGIVLTLIFHVSISGAWPFIWLGALTLVSTTLGWMSRRWARQYTSPASARIYAFKFSAGAALLGLTWSVACLVFSYLGNSLIMAAILTVVSGINAGALATLSPIFVTYLCFALSACVPVFWPLLSSDQTAVQLLSVVLALYIGFLAYFARNFFMASRSAITLRFTNLELLGQLREETLRATQAKTQAEAASQAKTRFLAAASHDLRQPLHAQNLFLEALVHEDLPPSARHLLNRAVHAGMASRSMLNTLLDYSRIDAGVITPVLRPFKLQTLLSSIERDMGIQADQKGLIWRTLERPWWVVSDPSLLDLILRNLIGNAIRYTDQGGLIVGARRRGHEVCLEVWDTGRGIAPEALEDIFEAFYQVGNPQRDRQQGLGLGLSIARGLADTLGHRLSVQSRLGKGSVFRLSLPFAEAAQHAMDLTPPPPPLPIATLAPLNATVLLVEDDREVMASLQATMSAWGCQYLAASHAQEAIELGASQHFDVLLVDWRLPDNLTGGHVIERLRQVTSHTWSAIVLTGDTAPDRLREAMAAGAKLMHKPVDTVELRRVLADVLKANA